MATVLSKKKGNILSPRESTFLNRSKRQKLSRVIMSVTPTAVSHLLQIRPRGRLCKSPKYNEILKYIYTFLETSLHTAPVDELSHVMAQTTEIHARVCRVAALTIYLRVTWMLDFGVRRKFIRNSSCNI